MTMTRITLKRGSQGHGHVRDLRRALSQYVYVLLSYLTYGIPQERGSHITDAEIQIHRH